MLKRFLYIGLTDEVQGFVFHKIYKGKDLGKDLIVWNNYNEECNVYANDFVDVTSSLRFTPYCECLINTSSLIKGELYQTFTYNNKPYAIDSNNEIVLIKENYFQEFKSIKIDVFKAK